MSFFAQSVSWAQLGERRTDPVQAPRDGRLRGWAGIVEGPLSRPSAGDSVELKATSVIRTSSPSAGRRSREAGFTISELILVVVVLTGLVFVATTSVRGLRRSEDTTDCVSERRQVAVANEWFKGETGAYASSVHQLEQANALKRGTVQHWELAGISGDTTATYRGTGPCA